MNLQKYNGKICIMLTFLNSLTPKTTNGVCLMSKLKTTTKNLVTSGYHMLSHVCDKLLTTLDKARSATTNLCLPTAAKSFSSSTIKLLVGSVFNPLGQSVKVMGCMKNAAVRLIGFVAGKTIILGHALFCSLVRIASILGIVGFVFATGSVVVPVSEANAQGRVFTTPMDALTKRNVIEPASSSDSMMVSFDFVPSGTFTETFPLNVSVISADTTATVGTDFVMPPTSVNFTGTSTQTFSVEILG